MQIFVIKLRIFLTQSQIDSSLFDCVRVMKILYMLSKIQTNTPKKQWNFFVIVLKIFSCCRIKITLYLTALWRSCACCQKYIVTNLPLQI